MTRVSVCMATFNGAPFIREQVASILAQLGENDELIIADDGSEDGTLDIVAEFADRRIQLLHNNFRNIARNFESALRQTQGNFVFLSDQDDVWLHGKVALTAELLQEYPLVVSDCVVVGAVGEVVQPSYFEAISSGPGLLRNFGRNSYLGCCMAFRRSLLQAVLPIPRGIAHDYWIGMMCELISRPYFFKRPLVLYRRHGATASFAGGRSGRSLGQRIWSRAVLAAHLAVRLIDMKIGRLAALP